MNENRFLRKARTPESLPPDAQNELAFCLLRVLFDVEDDGDKDALKAAGIDFKGEAYSVKELAAELGISKFSVYPMFSEARPVSFPRILKMLDFIHWKNPNDLRLIDFINRYADCTAMPNRKGVDHRAARTLVMEAYSILGMKGEGK